MPPRQVLASSVPRGSVVPARLTDLGACAATGKVERSSLTICKLTTPNDSATSRLSRQVARHIPQKPTLRRGVFSIVERRAVGWLLIALPLQAFE